MLSEAPHTRHFSHRTERTYCHWVKGSFYFHNVRHPCKIWESEINAFLMTFGAKRYRGRFSQNP
jgi:hypothetical protein